MDGFRRNDGPPCYFGCLPAGGRSMGFAAILAHRQTIQSGAGRRSPSGFRPSTGRPTPISSPDRPHAGAAKLTDDRGYGHHAHSRYLSGLSCRSSSGPPSFGLAGGPLTARHLLLSSGGTSGRHRLTGAWVARICLLSSFFAVCIIVSSLPLAGLLPLGGLKRVAPAPYSFRFCAASCRLDNLFSSSSPSKRYPLGGCVFLFVETLLPLYRFYVNTNSVLFLSKSGICRQHEKTWRHHPREA